MPDVICMGELLAEFVATKDNVSLADAPGFVKAPGGAPANVAVALARLGMSSGFAGKVGDDPFGVYLRSSLDDAGVDTSMLLVDPHARTTAVFVAVWDDGHKDLCFYRNPGADMMLAPAEIDASAIRSARAFHYGSIGYIDEPVASAQAQAVRIALDAGLMVSFDPNYRPTLWANADRAHRVIMESYGSCHLAKISEEEWEVATGRSDLSSGVDEILRRGVELLVVSRGPDGAFATNGDYSIEVPSPSVDVVETTGAGDGFMAAMIARLLPLRERLGSLSKIDRAVVEDALRYATAVGALTCTRRGAIPALPTAAEVDRFIAG